MKEDANMSLMAEVLKRGRKEGSARKQRKEQESGVTRITSTRTQDEKKCWTE
jgi:hypothetical protein